MVYAQSLNEFHAKEKIEEEKALLGYPCKGCVCIGLDGYILNCALQ